MTVGQSYVNIIYCIDAEKIEKIYFNCILLTNKGNINISMQIFVFGE